VFIKHRILLNSFELGLGILSVVGEGVGATTRFDHVVVAVNGFISIAAPINGMCLASDAGNALRMMDSFLLVFELELRRSIETFDEELVVMTSLIRLWGSWKLTN